MAKLEKRAKQNPKLEKRTLVDGRMSLCRTILVMEYQ